MRQRHLFSSLLQLSKFCPQAILLAHKRLNTRMFFLEQAHSCLTLLFQFQELSLDFTFLIQVGVRFTGHIHRTDAVTVIRQNLFDTVEFSLHTRELLFQEFKSLGGFGTAHFNILAQIRLCHRIQDRSSPIRIAMVVASFDDTALLAFFCNLKPILQSSDGTQHARLRKDKFLTRFCKHFRNVNIESVTSVSGLVHLTDFTFQNDLFFRRNDFVSIFINSSSHPLFGTSKFGDIEGIQVHASLFVRKAIDSANWGCIKAKAFCFDNIA